VTYLHFDYRFTVDLWSAERGISVTFGTTLTLSIRSRGGQILDPEQNETLGPLLSLLHREASSFGASSEGGCVLRLADGSELRGQPHPQYEAWEAHGTGGLAGISLLCGPGGGPPWVTEIMHDHQLRG
jgi:hypothetical protein